MQRAMSRFMISAAHKSSGKTTLSVGLCAALSAQGQKVQAFKKGPDYIDPMWLTQASGRPCFNLDPYLMDTPAIQALFQQHATGADITLVEGNKGLYDGLALDGSNSNAALACMLGLPVVLVIDARGMTRGIAPLILGYQAFDRNVRIAGVILNRLGGSRHESKLREVIEHYTDVPVIGAVAQDPVLEVAERHLGLIPSNEHSAAAEQIQRMGERIAAQVDLHRLRAIAAAAPEQAVAPAVFSLPASSTANCAGSAKPAGLRIGIAQDAAFGFYYPDDLAAFKAEGAELVPFSTLHDPTLPAGLDGLFIGGGFPELWMEQLEANHTMRTSIATALAVGLPTYAECGGLMYLARSLQWKGKTCQMVGTIAGDVLMHDKPVGRGYVSLEATPDMPWPALHQAPVRGHEFHYSSLEGLPADTRFAWKVKRGHGVNGQFDGIVQGNLLASYSHLRQLAGAAWVSAFVQRVQGLRADPHTRVIQVNGTPVLTDSEGYLLNREQWSESFALALAEQEQLPLQDAHWQVIRWLREYYAEHGVQAQVRAMIKHFSTQWDTLRGSNHALHDLFPRGGPQKQGNRLAGLLRTKGEH